MIDTPGRRCYFGVAFAVDLADGQSLSLSGGRLRAPGYMRPEEAAGGRLRFTHDKLRGVRFKGDADWADSFLGINQVNVTFSQGIKGLGSSDSAIPNNPNPPVPAPSTNAGRVDFSKIEANLPGFQPQWTLRKGIEELYRAYTKAGLDEDTWKGPRYYRLRTVRGLQERGKLDQELRWIR